MPPTDPTATVRLADCPVGAVVQWSPMSGDIGFVEPDDAANWSDLPVRLLAPSLAALVARAEAGARLAEECEAASERHGIMPMYALGEIRQALADYRKATA